MGMRIGMGIGMGMGMRMGIGVKTDGYRERNVLIIRRIFENQFYTIDLYSLFYVPYSIFYVPYSMFHTQYSML